MTTETKKELTVGRYEFFKEKGMTDVLVAKQFGMTGNQLNQWKDEHNLIGKKYGLQGKRPTDIKNVKISEEDVQLLKENKIPKERIAESYRPNKKLQEKIIEKKPSAGWERVKEMTKELSEEIKADVLTAYDKPVETKMVPSEPVTEEVTAVLADVVEEPAKEEFKMPEVTQVDEPDYEKDIAWLNERHAADTENIRLLRADIKHLQKERYEIIERSDRWREKFLTMDEENGKLLKELESRDQMMEKSALREDYLFQTMELAQDMRKLYLAGRGVEF